MTEKALNLDDIAGQVKQGIDAQFSAGNPVCPCFSCAARIAGEILGGQGQSSEHAALVSAMVMFFVHRIIYEMGGKVTIEIPPSEPSAAGSDRVH